ncbi:hypothetical protein T10_10275 [Trichinella papuae]|uniref:Uncharacterized protein n=1 Tax=Trichinella papuae TaxID=268474 RepID=A0A0V1MW54_9BILA|nr:hypothetical protein T10_10275 [Trichinella papuae]
MRLSAYSSGSQNPVDCDTLLKLQGWASFRVAEVWHMAQAPSEQTSTHLLQFRPFFYKAIQRVDFFASKAATHSLRTTELLHLLFNKISILILIS